MFRSRFSDHFPPKLAQIGPQDLERGVQEGLPTKEVEGTLCTLLGLVLNRKKPVEYEYPSRLDSSQYETRPSCAHARAWCRSMTLSESPANNATGKVTTVARSKKPSQATSRNGLSNGKARTRSTEGRTSITCRLKRGYVIPSLSKARAPV